LDYLECYELLGVRPGASVEQIHRAYKRLALRYHPDRASGRPDSLEKFYRITEAYTTLRRGLHREAAAGGRRPVPVGRCPRCGRTEELFQALHGGESCADCLLNTRRRFLPLPSVVTIRCLAVIALQAAAVGCAVSVGLTGQWQHGAAGLVAVIAALLGLAYNFWTADIIER